VSGEEQENRWQTDGKFFRAGKRRVRMSAVAYGPFPGGWPKSFDPEFERIRQAGFNAIRLYDMPEKALLDAAARHGLKVFGGLKWSQSADFFRNPGLYSAARVQLAEALRRTGEHPALAGVYVGNEVPADLARWMGPLKVRRAIEELIDLGREIAPGLLFAYANYPSTEYLEPENADFTAFNVYLEDEASFRGYVRRLHHIAGDRPLVISEFGLDSQRNGLEKQATILSWGCRAAAELEAAGMTVYTWSDRWWNAGQEVLDWDFGLTDRQGNAKPALAALEPLEREGKPAAALDQFSIIVCTRNGRARLDGCLKAIARMDGTGFETLVVDDGSTDGTAEFVAGRFPWVRLITQEPQGLSVARNTGAAAARGKILAFTDDDCEPDREWLLLLAPIFAERNFVAAGGPNLPPKPRSWQEAVVCAAPGAPSHVMLDDVEAEHLPGCNLVVTKEAFEAIGGFDARFHTAGDDVDFCWRLRDAGYRLGFVPGAFVWHWRRPYIRLFLRQQLGYGRAERLLLEKHPSRFSKRGGARWQGFIYGGGPVRVMSGSIIYHGELGQAGYQAITNRLLPLRGLGTSFNTFKARLGLKGVEFLQPRLRAWERNGVICLNMGLSTRPGKWVNVEEFTLDSQEGQEREYYLGILLRNGWKPCGETSVWDVRLGATRVMMATERGEGIGKRTLVRVAGPLVYRAKDILSGPPRKSLRAYIDEVDPGANERAIREPRRDGHKGMRRRR